MKSFFLLIPDFFIFWFWESPRGLFNYFSSVNNAFLKLFSFQVLAQSFFKPWKNEYREGLVEFSIFMGICIKSMVLFFDLVLLCIIILFEILFCAGFILWPFATIYLLFI